jgi:hypothetical protein
MLKKWKRFVMTVTSALVMTCLMFPLAVTANVPTTNAAVKGLSAQNIAVNAGQPKSISVITNAETTHVFATVNGANVAGTRQSEDSAGNITWNITFTANNTQVVPIYVNTANSTEGAVVLNVQVTVTGTAAASTPAAASSTTGVVINDITESRGTSAGSVVLTVQTNTTAADVWVQFDTDRYALGRLESETAQAKTWTITFRPRNAQTVSVSANTGYFTRGAAVTPFNVTLNPAATATGATRTGNATITNLRSNRSNLVTNENMTLTITTNAHATHVWVDVDNRDVAARVSRETRTTKTWTVTFTPERTQTLTVYANSGSDSVEGSVNRTHRVTVNERRAENARIISASASTHGNNANHWQWNWATITVETNSTANHVWVEVNGNRRTASANYTTLSNGNRRWTLELDWFDWDWNHNVRVHAGETSHTSNDSRTVSIDNWWFNQNWNIWINHGTVAQTVTITTDAWNWTNNNNFGNISIRLVNVVSGTFATYGVNHTLTDIPVQPGTYRAELYAGGTLVRSTSNLTVSAAP